MLRSTLIAVTVFMLSLAPVAQARIKFPKMPWQKSDTKTEAKAVKKAPTSKERAKVGKDVHKLESLLANVKTSAKLSKKSWTSAANEADQIANRIYTNVKSTTSEKNALSNAEELRTHVKNMKNEAIKGDYKQSKRHADRALTVAARLDEWSS